MKFNFSRSGNERLGEIRGIEDKRSLISAIEKVREKGLNPIIGEIKRKSPSLGNIREIDIGEAAIQIEAGGACAISVLTDKHFGGSLEDLKEVKKIVKIPVLRKDFIVDELQLYGSCAYGADAILLITSLLKEKTKRFVRKAKELEMESLVEIHSEEDLKFALDSKARLIGINNRNLKTLEVELGTTEELIKKIPEKKIKVSESGINTKEDLKKIFNVGTDAALIGTSIMKAEDIEEKVREFVENGY